MNAKHTPGIDSDTLAALRTIVAARPWGRDRISRKAAAFLDGRCALDDAPALRDKLNAAATTIRAALARVEGA